MEILNSRLDKRLVRMVYLSLGAGCNLTAVCAQVLGRKLVWSKQGSSHPEQAIRSDNFQGPDIS